LETKVLACTCNGTVAVVEPGTVNVAGKASLSLQHDALCRRGLSKFLDEIRSADAIGQPIVVTCTQESLLFSKAAPQTSEIKFVNIREHAGWGVEAGSASAKISALIANAVSAVAPQLPSVSYSSSGKTLVVADADLSSAQHWASELAASANLEVSFLWLGNGTRGATKGATKGADKGADLGATKPSSSIARRYAKLSGANFQLSGWLGRFNASWSQDNPIDWEACVGCGACVSACPEAAISESFQVDLDKCKSHRSCVAACDTAGAIDFSRLVDSSTIRKSSFDTVFDLRAQSAFLRDAPQGYFWAGTSAQQQMHAALELTQSIGEFEKPKYFEYKAKSCAHSRNSKTNCTKCIDVCSTGAISSIGSEVKVEPHLCMGCGSCSTVCPTGAMRYVAPDSAEMGRRLRVLLSTYRKAGGKDAVIAFYDRRHGNPVFETQSFSAPKGFKGIPARVIPLEVEHVGSVGQELLLAAKAYGASQAFIVRGFGMDEKYIEALTLQSTIANEIVVGLGFAGKHFGLLDGGNEQAFADDVWGLTPAKTVQTSGSFELSKDKREALTFSLEYLAEQAVKQSAISELSVIALSKGAAFGAIEVNAQSCTLCMACTSVCPKAALLDGQDKPQLRFIEANCVQCGLCEQTCPESAITLVSRLNLTAAAKQPAVVSETEPMNCTSCGKPFGTRQMVEAMLGKLAGHSMFSGDGLKRLKMCADCRVVDLIQNPVDASIHDYMPQSSGAVTALTRNKGPNQ
jgi:ferredoxin